MIEPETPGAIMHLLLLENNETRQSANLSLGSGAEGGLSMHSKVFRNFEPASPTLEIQADGHITHLNMHLLKALNSPPSLPMHSRHSGRP